VLNSLSNDDAMWVLQNGFAGAPKRRYISAQGAKAHPLPGVRGGCVYFLGPPRDPRNLAAMDPPKAQRWLAPSVTAASPAAGAGRRRGPGPLSPASRCRPATSRAGIRTSSSTTSCSPRSARSPVDTLTARRCWTGPSTTRA
jgi:hypothetical protein